MRRLPLVVLLLACEDTEAPGAVEVGWRLAGRTCAEAGLTEVEAALYDYSSAAPRFTARTACVDGVLTMGGIEPGRYALILTGLEADDCVTHEARSDTVRVVRAETTTVPNLLLTRRPRTLDVAWPFANREGCAENGVAQVAIEVSVNGLLERRVPALCSSEIVHLPDITPGALEVRVIGYDGAGIAIAQGAASARDPASECADVVAVQVPLELCLEPGC